MTLEPTTIRLEPETHKNLARIAAARKPPITISYLIREMIERQLPKYQSAKGARND